MISPIVREKIEKKFGRPIRYSSDVEALSIEIKNATGQSIGVNTLKRLLGTVNDVSEPRIYTLDIVAHYLGYETWDEMMAVDENHGNSGFSSMEEIEISQLEAGALVRFSYSPDRMVKLRYEGEENRFTVVYSENSKLRMGDVLEIDHFILKYPLIVRRVVRAGVSLGEYTAGRVSGLTSLSIVEK